MEKKELKKAYKQTHTHMGVFQIKNKINGKIFLESGTNLTAKLNKYRFELKYGSCRIKELQKDWNELGEENFSFEILDRLEPKEDITINYTDEIKALEGLWLEKVQPFGEKGYNIIKNSC